MKESKTTYSYLIEHMQNPTFQKVWDIAYDFVQKLPAELCEELHDSLNRGVDILDSEPLLQMYLYSYGKMHKAKLYYAFGNLHENVFKYNDVEIVDYGCGQGLATICYHDYMIDHEAEQHVKKITLIEPSKMALSRAELLCSTFFPEAEIVAINKQFDELIVDDLLILNDTPTIHLFSNILDVESYDLTYLSRIVREQSTGENEYVIVSPMQSARRVNRLKSFASSIEKRIYFEKFLDKRELQEDKDWTCVVLLCTTNHNICKEFGFNIDDICNKAFHLLDNRDRNNKEFQTVFNNIKRGADIGDVKCLNALGCLYYSGYGTTKDDLKAFSFFEESARKRFPPAIANLARCYYFGFGTCVNYNKAVELLKEAVALEYLPSYSFLAVCYFDGRGCDINKTKGIHMLKYAAEKNDARAQCILGKLYIEGNGINKDLTLGINLIKKSVKQNYRNAYYVLGQCYQRGIGVEVDFQKAIRYFTKAGMLDLKDAIISLIGIFEKIEYKDLFGDEQFDVFVKGVYLGIQEISRITVTWSNREPTNIMDGDVIYGSNGLRLIKTVRNYE